MPAIVQDEVFSDLLEAAEAVNTEGKRSSHYTSTRGTGNTTNLENTKLALT
jgi:hypothetical protein